MSRRKQNRPKSVKDELENDDEPKSKRSSIKEEPIDSDEIPCQLCEERFGSISDLQTHTIWSHAQPQQAPVQALECQQCDAVLPSFPAFVLHMRVHLKSGNDRPREDVLAIYPCGQCPVQFNNMQARQQHLLTHFETTVTRLQCSDCSFVGINPSLMTQHHTERHLKTQHLCTICAQICDSIKEFKEHCASHSLNSIFFECVACRVPFESRDLLMMHVQLIHDKEDANPGGADTSVIRNIQSNVTEREKILRILHCSVCDAKCVGEEALDEHRLFSHCKVIHSDVCAECFEPIKTPEDFKNHTRAHMRDMYMNCAVCRQSLRNESQLQLHAQFHMERKEEKHEAEPSGSQASLINQESALYKCDFYEQRFPTKTQTDDHRSAVHEPNSEKPEQDENSFQCGICHEIFGSSSLLYSHLQSSRDCSPSIRCPICALAFNTVSRFENHLKRHNNTPTCTCQICGIAFLRREELDEHMQLHKGNLEINRIST